MVRSRRYPRETSTDAVYRDDMRFPANTFIQAESLRHNMEQTARDVGLHVNADRTWVLIKKEPSSRVMFWPVDPDKNAIQGDAPEGSDTF